MLFFIASHRTHSIWQFVFAKKNKCDVSFSSVCSVVDNKLRHNIVKEVQGSTRLSPHGSWSIRDQKNFYPVSVLASLASTQTFFGHAIRLSKNFAKYRWSRSLRNHACIRAYNTRRLTLRKQIDVQSSLHDKYQINDVQGLPFSLLWAILPSRFQRIRSVAKANTVVFK